MFYLLDFIWICLFLCHESRRMQKIFGRARCDPAVDALYLEDNEISDKLQDVCPVAPVKCVFQHVVIKRY